MRSIRVNLPTHDYQPGDVAVVSLDGTVIRRDLPLVPGNIEHPGHLLGGHLVNPHLEPYLDAGHLGGKHLYGPHLTPERWIEFDTRSLYHGLHTVAVKTRDPIGNESSEADSETFLNTGPPSPADIRFDSQAPAGGPITFAFTPSPELAA